MGAAGFSRSFTQIFPSSPTYCGRGIAEEGPLTPCRRHSPMDCHRQKNPVLSDEALMLLLPFSWAGQVLSLRLSRYLWHLAARKSPVLSDEALMLALPTFLGRPSIVLAFNKMPVASCSKKEPCPFGRGSYVGITYLPGQAKYCSCV